MPHKKVFLRSPKDLPRAVSQLERVVYGEILQALRKTARYAETKAVQTARSTRPKPLAHGAYMNAWGVQDTPAGAIMGNSAYHSYFVEVGRKPGRKPPLAPIIDWINAKRISQRRMRQALGIQKVKRKRGGPRPEYVSTSDETEDEISDETEGEANVWEGVKKRAAQREKRRRRAAIKKAKLVRSYAFYVQYVIGRYGTRGRYVLRRAMPAIQKRFKRELRKSLKQAISKYRV